MLLTCIVYVTPIKATVQINWIGGALGLVLLLAVPSLSPSLALFSPDLSYLKLSVE